MKYKEPLEFLNFVLEYTFLVNWLVSDFSD